MRGALNTFKAPFLLPCAIIWVCEIMGNPTIYLIEIDKRVCFVSSRSDDRQAFMFIAGNIVQFLVTGESNSLLGIESTPLLALWSVVKQGWPGIVIPLGSLMILVPLIESFTTRNGGSRNE